MKNFKNHQDFYCAAGTVMVSLLAVYAIIWSFTADSFFGTSTYNSYILQAQRWLHGHLDLGQNYLYLEIAEFGGKFFISFPPIPSVILLPFVAMLGTAMPDHAVAVCISAIGSMYALKIAFSLGFRRNAAIFWTLLLTLGSNYLHIGYRADVWYFAQGCAFTFTMMSLYYAMSRCPNRMWLSLFCLALAVGCRPFNIVYLPLAAWLLLGTIRKLRISAKVYLWWLLPPLLVGLFLMGLNMARFGNPFEFGHNYLPEFAKESPLGQFHIRYLLPNLKQMFRLPALENGRMVFPIFNGVALYLVSPIFLVWAWQMVRQLAKSPRDALCWLCTLLPILHLLWLCCHKTMGGWQFGNRYTIDLLPCIYFGMLLYTKKREQPPTALYPLFFWGLGVNLVGTIALMEQWLS